MRKVISIISLTLALAFSNAGCAQAQSTALAGATGQGAASPGRGDSHTQKFIPVEGAGLRAKLEAAASRARASNSGPYWTAYGFDVRPGVAVDLSGGEFRGMMNSVGDTAVFIGTTNGVTAETRDLAVFALREPGREAVTRLEVYNLRRPREYSGHTVYWAGRAGNEESLDYLRALAGSGPGDSVRERATLAVALHDDARVAGILKGLARAGQNMKVRSTAVFWLGQAGGETEYLAGIVRDQQEHTDLRETAAHAIGAGRGPEVLNTLQTLYSSVTHGEVRRAIIHAVADNDDRGAAYAFLLKVARGDSDREARSQAVHRLGDGWGDAAVDDLTGIYASERDLEVRQAVIHALSEVKNARADAKLVEIARSGDHKELREQAIHQLGERGTEGAFGELVKLFAAERDHEVKSQILHAFSEMKSPRADAKLLDVARDRGEHPEVRQQAIHWLGERDGDSAVDELMKIFRGEPSREVREQILHALSEMKSRRAEDILFEIARGGDRELREQAIHRLGELAGERSLTLLRNTVNSGGEKTEIQVQAVRAISEKPANQAVPLLINIARTHPNPEVRKEAIRQLGDSGDPRAVEFFREILTK